MSYSGSVVDVMKPPHPPPLDVRVPSPPCPSKTLRTLVETTLVPVVGDRSSGDHGRFVCGMELIARNGRDGIERRCRGRNK
jgi:hypothetical protein